MHRIEGGGRGSQRKAEEEKSIDYKKVYLEILEGLQESYGPGRQDENTGILSGLLHAELVDFDGDGLPELVSVCGRQVRIYRAEAAGAKILMEAQAAGEFGHTDLSWTIRFARVEEKPYIVLNHSEDEWRQDSWTAYTVEDGALKTRVFWAETDGKNPFPGEEFLSRFRIDGQAVSGESYQAEKARFYSQSVRALDLASGDPTALQTDLEKLLEDLKG